MVASGTGGEVRAAVKIGLLEDGLEMSHGAVGFGAYAPVFASRGEKASSCDDAVGDANGMAVADGFPGGCSEGHAVLNAVEDCIDGGVFSCPGLTHGEEIGVEFGFGNGSVFGPKMREKGKDRDLAESMSWMFQLLNVRVRDGLDELGAEGTVGRCVPVEEFAIDGVLADGFGDNGSRSVGSVDGVDRGTGRNVKWDVGSKCEVFSLRDGEGKVPVSATAVLGVDGGGVLVQLTLGALERGERRRRGDGGDRIEDGSREGGQDSCSGDGSGRGHGRFNCLTLLLMSLNSDSLSLIHI